MLGFKKPGYRLNDAPRRWWQIIDKAVLDCGLVPTRADRCTDVPMCCMTTFPKPELINHARSVSTEQATISEEIDNLIYPVARDNAQGRRPHFLSSCR